MMTISTRYRSCHLLCLILKLPVNSLDTALTESVRANGKARRASTFKFQDGGKSLRGQERPSRISRSTGLQLIEGVKMPSSI